jgi:hypothetical protein
VTGRPTIFTALLLMHVAGGMVLTGHSVGVSKGKMPFDLPLNNYNIYLLNIRIFGASVSWL